MTTGRFPIPHSRFPLLLLLLACAPSYNPAPLTEPADPRFTSTAPDSFDVSMVTTKGEMIVRARRNWSPLGVDRFYTLVRNQFEIVAAERMRMASRKVRE